MYLWLSREHAQTIQQHALDASPCEVCGIIAGLNQRTSKVIPLPNIADNPQQNYHIDDCAFSEVFFQLQREGLSLLAFYHSHPTGDPIPSPTDIKQVTYDDVPYLIIGLRREPSFAAWSIQWDKVTPVDLYIGNQIPFQAEPSFSQVQRIAIIMAVAIAFAFMIILSLSLLPPAPIIITSVP
ncbi:MAG: M67 family metallopeptidase [Anaerolineae bacterium]|nr:M67 family metallopeptidase [Anaerolineae bacterium]